MPIKQGQCFKAINLPQSDGQVWCQLMPFGGLGVPEMWACPQQTPPGSGPYFCIGPLFGQCLTHGHHNAVWRMITKRFWNVSRSELAPTSTHHEGRMVKGQKTVRCCLLVPWLTMVVSSVAFETTYLMPTCKHVVSR